MPCAPAAADHIDLRWQRPELQRLLEHLDLQNWPILNLASDELVRMVRQGISENPRPRPGSSNFDQSMQDCTAWNKLKFELISAHLMPYEAPPAQDNPLLLDPPVLVKRMAPSSALRSL